MLSWKMPQCSLDLGTQKIRDHSVLPSESGAEGETWVGEIKVPSTDTRGRCTSFPLVTAQRERLQGVKGLCAVEKAGDTE